MRFIRGEWAYRYDTRSVDVWSSTCMRASACVRVRGCVHASAWVRACALWVAIKHYKCVWLRHTNAHMEASGHDWSEADNFVCRAFFLWSCGGKSGATCLRKFVKNSGFSTSAMLSIVRKETQCLWLNENGWMEISSSSHYCVGKIDTTWVYMKITDSPQPSFQKRNQSEGTGIAVNGLHSMVLEIAVQAVFTVQIRFNRRKSFPVHFLDLYTNTVLRLF